MRARSESGAILIFVGLTLAAMMALAAFVVDMGAMWLGRGQAQNAADAAALAAGTALIYDSYDDRTDTGPTHLSGVALAQSNAVFGAGATAVVVQNKDAIGWVPNSPQTCRDAPGSCVQASVFRDGTNGSTRLPGYFSYVFGVSDQQTRATATAQLLQANGTGCLKPWFAPDKSDVSHWGVGDLGTVLPLRYQSGPSNYFQINVCKSGGNGKGGGAACYGDAIEHCVGRTNGQPWAIGDVVEEKPGNTSGKQDQDKIYNQDPGASWNATTKSPQNSCANTHNCACAVDHSCANGLDGRISPRVLTIALFQPSALAAFGPGPDTATIVGFAAIFMLQPGTGPLPECTASPDNVCGYLTVAPGLTAGGGVPAPGNSLNVSLSLIR